ncbi:MAG: RrF2 family transcriptional regulator [Eubacterium sp.]|nr:RrF2 family transcriptional regulator [Eubacterium sp.]MBR1530633.1 RrF2 family transcriptional regulator [Eubacterium sp.]MBR2278868.1 RrF2 family transcriptional regulator [Eubacterium sp.]
MKISTKGRYALRLMIDLAEHKDEGYIPLKDISKRQEVSKKYLEQIIAIVNKPDVLRANRGSQGGYKLAKSPSHYTVGDILRLTEGSLSPVDCVDQDPIECPRSADCPTLPIWRNLSKIVNEYLDSVTLQDILDEQQKRNADNYVI